MEEESSSTEKPRLPDLERAFLAHIVPFAVWIFLLGLLKPASGWMYAIRTAVGVAVFIYFKPWSYYPKFEVKNLGLSLLVGVAVCGIWIGPELAFWPEGFQQAYAFVGMMPPWKETVIEVERIYAPETCGWPLALVRLAGSAFVIAIIEEFFWRGFLYRWLVGENDFRKTSLGLMAPGMFFLVALVFGLEHTRWLVGVMAGLAYGWLIIRTRDIWAGCIAHIVTNLLLGVYVLVTESYAFW